MNGKVLIVEDQFIEANHIQMVLEKAGYTVIAIAHDVRSALEIIDVTLPDLVLLDIYLKGNLTGIDLARVLRKRDIAFVYLSANSSREILDAAKSTQPYGFLVKPFREKDILVTLDIAHYLHQQKSELSKPQPPLDIPVNSALPTIVGSSPGLLEVMEKVRIAAPSDVSVLILGESGTGKEKIAESIHKLSDRRKHPFVRVNCAALPAALIESELFGHEKGAFTGASERRSGRFELAQNGTIFLDEIGELTLSMQAKLLHVLQEKQIDRIGGKTPIDLDIRIIAATNRNLEKEVAEGRFRLDLYYRLNVFPVALPPLRERKDDIMPLAIYFVQIFAAKFGKSVSGFSPSVSRQLVSYDWPGNIRELQHLIERSVLMSSGDTINGISLLNNAKAEISPEGGASKIKSMEEMERDYIIQILKKCSGRIAGTGGAAELLGLNVSTLNSRMKKLGINKSTTFFA
ncbi:DNA-binding transcriptional response regulator, NtrC family, contains REC, AAA-type ATPase, and a Fis-type DNA-binding domains [Dyadobacter soli]|uniref:DNA-binding transcriptional response regulator, NtrC family, contains REC, AAA-type ATPase, and a Fis-type DNA-binding domains n=1 Tax=Dyadobacter soli TaxID=659014 RepID=A0A1G7A7M3_9BACT|nr:sigma-54 dependent transcriptional regulator [Dyadobacter soli]SDE10928.1 DNA-binding transcriptional response regulator, NtrC family, contains REC, AAA-type ATPase, and a Fis-type DNA-binding domains [Dyadobacter soli]